MLSSVDVSSVRYVTVYFVYFYVRLMYILAVGLFSSAEEVLVKKMQNLRQQENVELEKP